MCVRERETVTVTERERERAREQTEGGILLLWADLQSQGQGHSDFLLVAEVT